MKDPEDVYRLWLPAHRRILVHLKADANVGLAVWGPKTRTVFERGAAQRRDLLAFSTRPRTLSQSVVVQARSAKNAYAYADVYLPLGVADATYRLTISTGRR